MNIYYASVGRNGSLLLNVPANKDGLIAKEDVQRLKEFREARDIDFKHDLAAERPVISNSNRKISPITDAKNIVKGRNGFYWAAKDGDIHPGVEIDLGKNIEFDCVKLREQIELGQRVEEFIIEAKVGGNWVQFAAGTTIGNCRIIKMPALRADKIKITILKARSAPTLSQVCVFKGA